MTYAQTDSCFRLIRRHNQALHRGSFRRLVLLRYTIRAHFHRLVARLVACIRFIVAVHRRRPRICWYPLPLSSSDCKLPRIRERRHHGAHLEAHSRTQVGVRPRSWWAWPERVQRELGARGANEERWTCGRAGRAGDIPWLAG